MEKNNIESVNDLVLYNWLKYVGDELKKIDKYKYISSMNRIRVLNQIANVSVVEEDGNIMKRLSNDAYDALIHKRGKNQ